MSSVFGRTGAVTAATGDYSVSQVTGAAVDSTVVHLAGTETITGAKTFSNNVTLSGNLNVAGNINQTGSGPTQWSGVEWTGTSVTVPGGMNFSLGVGSDNTFHCQLASGASCMSTGGGMIYPGTGIAYSTGVRVVEFLWDFGERNYAGTYCFAGFHRSAYGSGICSYEHYG